MLIQHKVIPVEISWYVPLLIFLARIGDVSIGTMRIIMVMRGNKLIAGVLGFFESLIWIFAVSTVIAYIKDSWITVIFYAGGFATGTLMGVWIEAWLAIGNQVVRVVNLEPGHGVADWLTESGYLVTRLEGEAGGKPAELCFVVVPRRQSGQVVDGVVSQFPRAFVTVEDVRSTLSGSTLFEDLPSRLPVYKRVIKYR